MSLNDRGLNSPYKHRTMWKMALDHSCDLLCLQETHFPSLNPLKCTHSKFQHIFTANDSVKRNGVLIAIKDSITFALLDKFIDVHGRFIILVAELNNTQYTLFNLYAPNTKPVKFIRKTLQKAKQMMKGNLVICVECGSK